MRSSRTSGSLKSVRIPGIKLNSGSSKSADPIAQFEKRQLSTEESRIILTFLGPGSLSKRAKKWSIIYGSLSIN
jgi:hypothetical protein